MSYLNSVRFILCLAFLSPRVFFLFIKDFFLSARLNRRADIDKYNNESFEEIVRFAFESCKYYQKIFSLKGVDYFLKNKAEIPLLDKNIIRSEFGDIVSNKNEPYRVLSSGGSTGEPLKYQISLLSDAYSHYLLYKGLKNGGYSLGDKIAVFAGGSLVSKKTSKKEKIVSILLNKRKYSSYGVTNQEINHIIRDMNIWKPKILRGYVSSILFMAEYIIDNKLEINFKLKSVFTTSEMLTPNARKVIEKAFSCSVFDSYGLNDGGLSAFECINHSMHIDPERGLLEVIDENSGENIFDKPGIIVATTLVERRFPLIRYKTGDLGVMSKKMCSCGKETYVLEKLVGRETDFLEINGKKVGSPVLTVLMGKVDCKKYQIIQEKDDSITFNLLVDNENEFIKKSKPLIVNSLQSHFGNIDINFKFIGEFEKSVNGKHKFIIRR
ncbi:hypothetical protein [Pseudoalteromonas lipolytica]|uniref:phenylacetate--CoA ligase family protein n=1 Tax=Pseudoalteromonas lipolytica TaxID=570156 RepID=UPI0030A11800